MHYDEADEFLNYRGCSFIGWVFVAVLIFAFFLCMCAGCSPASVERPTVNLPAALRYTNWGKGGSCCHAALCDLFTWQGHPETARWWRATHAYGANPTSLAEQLEAAGIRFAYTVGDRDTAWLEWACRTRRGCGVRIRTFDEFGQIDKETTHMVCLVHLDSRWACLLDSNPDNDGRGRLVYEWVPRQDFLDEWFAAHSWAVTPVYTPTAPVPQ